MSFKAMFAGADVVLVNKIDLMPHVEFDMDEFSKAVTGLNSEIKIFPVSCKTGEGLEQWFSWLSSQLKNKQNPS